MAPGSEEGAGLGREFHCQQVVKCHHAGGPVGVGGPPCPGSQCPRGLARCDTLGVSLVCPNVHNLSEVWEVG